MAVDKVNKSPLVYIVMPNYNGADYLEDSISSVINQTYSNWRLLIVDDHSQDGSRGIIKAFAEEDPRISYVFLPENTGRPAVPRNVGLKRAEGDYIAFIDSDDIWHPAKLEIQLNVMLSAEVDFVATSVCHFMDRNPVPFTISLGDIQSFRVRRYSHRDMLLKNRIISGSSSMLTLSVIRENGIFFNEDRRYRAVEDYLFWLKVLEVVGECVIIDAPLVFYRHSSNSISKQKLSMARKIYMLLREYEYNDGRKLGINIWGYLLSYVLLSLRDRLSIRRCNQLVLYRMLNRK